MGGDKPIEQKNPCKMPTICNSSHILTGVYGVGILDVVIVRLLEKKSMLLCIGLSATLQHLDYLCAL